MRLSVFFGISESEGQKMDYYLPDILKAVRNYLRSIGTPVECPADIGYNDFNLHNLVRQH